MKSKKLFLKKLQVKELREISEMLKNTQEECREKEGHLKVNLCYDQLFLLDNLSPDSDL